MRILHIHSGNIYGGVESMLASLAQRDALAGGVEQEFALSFPGRIHQELVGDGATVHDLGPTRVHKPWRIPEARRRVANILREGSFDAAICHMAWTHALLGPAVRHAGVPLIHWAHNPVDRNHWLERWASITRPDLIIANSRFVASTLPSLYHGVPVEVIYCPVSRPTTGPECRSLKRRELRTPDDAVVILHASRMQEWKGQRVLLEALMEMKSDPNWVCWIAGGPQRNHEYRYFDRLREHARSHGLSDRVRFLGQRSDVRTLFSASDVYCQPNTRPEPFGVSFIEALWAGLPVVGTALGGALEIVEARCGILTPPRNTIALAQALSKLVASEPLRNALGMNGPARAALLCEPSLRKQQLGATVARHCAGKPLSTLQKDKMAHCA